MASPGAAGLAGGTDFVTMRRAGAIAPDTVVDLKPLAELRELDALRIGSGVTMARLARLRSTPAAALRDGAALVGSPMTRNRATVGGNVCRASPAGDVLPPLLVLGAWARLASAAGVRELALDRPLPRPWPDRARARRAARRPRPRPLHGRERIPSG